MNFVGREMVTWMNEENKIQPWKEGIRTSIFYSNRRDFNGFGEKVLCVFHRI